MQCSTDLCKFVVVLTTIFTLVPATVLLVSMSSGCLAVLTWAWNKLLRFKKAEDTGTLAYKRKKVLREVCIALTTLVLLAAALALGELGIFRTYSNHFRSISVSIFTH